MTNFRWGWNVNGQRVGDESYFLNHLARLQPTWLLIMNNPALARRVLDVSPQTNVIDRGWSNHEGRQWRFMSPADYANSLKGGDKRIWRYLLNEPNATGAQEAQQRNDWLVAVAQLMTDDGYRVVVGNFASGSWESSHIDAGAYDNLLRFISQHPGVAKLGLHEYGAIVLPMNKDRYMAQHLTDRNMVQPETWLYLDHDNEALRLPDYRNEYVGHFYHLLRSHWLQRRCQTIGITPVEIVFTEFGWDYLPDLSGQLYETLKNQHGLPSPYSSIQGPYTLANIWRHYWGWDVSTAILEQFIWCDKNYIPEWYVGFCPFMWSFGDHWDTVSGYNYGADTELHHLLEAWSHNTRNETDPTPDPDPIPEPQPMPDTIDVLDYMRGDGRVYDVRYHFPGNQWEHGEERMQTQTDGRRFFHVKGAPGGTIYNWEELFYDHDFIYRRTDVSPSPTEYYHADEDNGYGQKWIPRHVKVGDRHLATPIVTWRYKENCRLVDGKPPYVFPHWIEVKAIHSTYTFEQSGITLNDVLELWGYLDNGASPGTNFERYWYAKGFGLVAWQDPLKNWRSWLANPSVNVGDLPRKVYPCLTLPDLLPLEDKPDMTFPLTDPRWQPVFVTLNPNRTLWNIRPEPNTNNTPIDRISATANNRHALILFEEAREMADGRWLPIRVADDTYAPFDKDLFTKSGWIRDDGITTEAYEVPTPDPEPEPQLPHNYFYLPLPEMNATQDDLDDLADVFSLIAKIGKLAPYIEWLSTLMENWEETKSGTYDGIILVPDEGEGD